MSNIPRKDVAKGIMEKQFIIAEIKRTARENGAPLGHRKFESETGIRPYEWQGHWAKWNDAVAEAGLGPNSKSSAYSDEFLIGQLVLLIRELGRFPTNGDMRVKSRNGSDLPTEKTYRRRFESKFRLIHGVLDYCKGRDDCQDIVEKVMNAFERRRLRAMRKMTMQPVVRVV